MVEQFSAVGADIPPAIVHIPPPSAPQYEAPVDHVAAAARALATPTAGDAVALLSYANPHLCDSAKPLPSRTDTAATEAALTVIRMAQLLTEDAACPHRADRHFRALIDSTPGSWSEIANAIVPYTAEDARFARHHIRKTLELRLERPTDSQEFQEVLAYLFENRALPEILAQAHQWRCEPHRGLALLKDESRAANLEVMIRLNRQHNSRHGLSW
jgi:hypothetical protein